MGLKKHAKAVAQTKQIMNRLPPPIKGYNMAMVEQCTRVTNPQIPWVLLFPETSTLEQDNAVDLGALSFLDDLIHARNPQTGANLRSRRLVLC